MVLYAPQNAVPTFLGAKVQHLRQKRQAMTFNTPVALFPHHVPQGEKKNRTVVEAVISSEINRRGKSKLAQRGIGLDVKVSPAIIEGDGYSARRKRAVLQPEKRLAQIENIGAEVFHHRQPALENRSGQKHFRMRIVLCSHGNAVVTKNQQPARSPSAARDGRKQPQTPGLQQRSLCRLKKTLHSHALDYYSRVVAVPGSAAMFGP